MWNCLSDLSLDTFLVTRPPLVSIPLEGRGSFFAFCCIAPLGEGKDGWLDVEA